MKTSDTNHKMWGGNNKTFRKYQSKMHSFNIQVP